MQLPQRHVLRLLRNLRFRIPPFSRLVEMQAAVRDVARCACGLVFGGGELAVAVGELAEEGGVGVVEDVEGAGGHFGSEGGGG